VWPLHNTRSRNNASTGDALFSGTPSAAGGVSFCTGADNYQFNYNWICGKPEPRRRVVPCILASATTALAHITGFRFNRKPNATLPTNGAVLRVLGANPDRTLPTAMNAHGDRVDAHLSLHRTTC